MTAASIERKGSGHPSAATRRAVEARAAESADGAPDVRDAQVAPKGPARRSQAGRRRRHAPAVVAAVGMLVLWHLIVVGFGVPSYIAPTPIQVLQVFVDQGDILWINF